MVLQWGGKLHGRKESALVILRCTKRLLKALDITPTDAVALSTHVLGEWYAHLIETAAGDLVVFANARTLLSVALPAAALPQLIPLFAVRVYNLLRIIGVPKKSAAQEISMYRDALFTRTADRSVLGSLNEIARYYQYVAETSGPDEPLNLQQVELTLSRYLHKPLEYSHPADIAVDLFTGGQKD
jgi:hypothetical protein